jgi:hypothetical protein
VRVVGVAQKESLILDGDKSFAALRHIERGVSGVKCFGEAIGVGDGHWKQVQRNKGQDTQRDEQAGAGMHAV